MPFCRRSGPALQVRCRTSCPKGRPGLSCLSYSGRIREKGLTDSTEATFFPQLPKVATVTVAAPNLIIRPSLLHGLPETLFASV